MYEATSVKSCWTSAFLIITTTVILFSSLESLRTRTGGCQCNLPLLRFLELRVRLVEFSLQVLVFISQLFVIRHKIIIHCACISNSTLLGFVILLLLTVLIILPPQIPCAGCLFTNFTFLFNDPMLPAFQRPFVLPETLLDCLHVLQTGYFV